MKKKEKKHFDQASFNEVYLLGGVATAPELMELPDGKKYVKFKLVTKKGYICSHSGEDKVFETYHNIQVKVKEMIYPSLKLTKGTQIFIKGQIEYLAWQNKKTKKWINMTVINPFIIQLMGRVAGQGGGKIHNEDEDYNVETQDYSKEKVEDNTDYSNYLYDDEPGF